MKARDLMTPDVVTVAPNTPVMGVARLLAERHISGVPVTDADRRILGVVTEGDLIKQVSGRHDETPGFFKSLFADPARMAQQYLKSHGRTAADIMTPNPLTVTEDTPAGEIAELLDKEHVRRVFVTRDGRLVGVVSRADLLRALVSPPSATTGGDTSDEGIYRAIMAEMRKQPWASTFYTTVVVKDGVVEFYGYCGTDEYRRALRVLAEGVPGVKRVEDHMVIGPLYVYS
ncbi:CBS domain-containing protein [Elioraea sp.]|uniref:CBS domain-containing protein n=1 Tax=Elioraea sp. TaxID=2185103 RepID=UPI0021DF2144|nr:CBS domain-containing protein [Elioraea sp.]GIX08819.1 MAG: histidine kinase [Elioraea sp.]